MVCAAAGAIRAAPARQASGTIFCQKGIECSKNSHRRDGTSRAGGGNVGANSPFAPQHCQANRRGAMVALARCGVCAYSCDFGVLTMTASSSPSVDPSRIFEQADCFYKALAVLCNVEPEDTQLAVTLGEPVMVIGALTIELFL